MFYFRLVSLEHFSPNSLGQRNAPKRFSSPKTQLSAKETEISVFWSVFKKSFIYLFQLFFLQKFVFNLYFSNSVFNEIWITSVKECGISKFNFTFDCCLPIQNNLIDDLPFGGLGVVKTIFLLFFLVPSRFQRFIRFKCLKTSR